MSGALIIEGIEAYAPEVRTLRERVLLIREIDGLTQGMVDRMTTSSGPNSPG
jgi:hypothetical protein